MITFSLSIILAIAFFLIAILYSTVGLGGGSSYTALLLMIETIPYTLIPSLSLICNLVVTFEGFLAFYRSGNLRWKLTWPFLLSSIPMSFLGGSLMVSKKHFLLTLGSCLLLGGLRLLIFPTYSLGRLGSAVRPIPFIPALLIGGILGFLAGLVGIGGGIFLSPILYFFHWGHPRQISATTVCFILLNSLAGLAGQWTKMEVSFSSHSTSWFWILPFLAVMIGGVIGPRLGSKILSFKILERWTGVVISLIAVKIIRDAII